MESLANRIDGITKALAHLVMWLAVALVVVQFIVVVLRYVFSIGSISLQESLWAMNGVLFAIGAAYALMVNKHIRIDILHGSLPPRRRALVDLLGAVFLLLPVAIAIVWTSASFVLASWRVLEGSTEVSGLRIVFLLKSMIWVMAALLFAQGISIAIRSWQTLVSDGVQIAGPDSEHD